MRERHPFSPASFVVGLLALGIGGLYLLGVSLHPRWDLDVDPVYVGGAVLLLAGLYGITRALAELRGADVSE